MRIEDGAQVFPLSQWQRCQGARFVASTGGWGSWDDTFRLLDECLLLDPWNAQVRMDRVLEKTLQGDLLRAAHELSNVARLSPASPDLASVNQMLRSNAAIASKSRFIGGKESTQ